MKRLMSALGWAVLPLCAAAAEVVEYPEGYRNWTHVKSMVIEQGHALYESFGGIHHIYANESALRGYRAGEFPDGSVLVFDLLEAQAEDHALVEGPRKVLGVMVKDRTRFAATGGWGFEGFAGGDPNQRVVADKAAEACFACHAQQRERDYVFSSWRD
ncbi:MAG: cytochrome c oxidase subunit III [Porticoccaceae bacterium]|nr:MAG: cytochrome c oxidase subunit III [Porticoccaceae bacterium]